MNKVTLNVPPDIVAQLDAVAEAQYRSRSSLATQILAEALAVRSAGREKQEAVAQYLQGQSAWPTSESGSQFAHDVATRFDLAVESYSFTAEADGYMLRNAACLRRK